MNSTKDIKKAVQAYIDTAETPYAIMIDGDWGCGKTHLWKQTLLPLVGEKEALYVSLFGLKNIKDIESEIFKAMSFITEKEGGVIKGLLGKSKLEISDDVSIGGIGFVAQYGMQKWKEKRLEKSKKLFICFDDLERWSGDIEECLAYINKLTEHHGTKCLIIGNSKKISEKCKSNFGKTKDKTIGFTYQLTHNPNDVIDVAFKLTNFSSESSEKTITQIYTDNKVRIDELLFESKCSNIRVVSTAVSYLDKIVAENGAKFKLSTTSSVDYFTELLSTVILLEMYLSTEEAKKEVLESRIGESDSVLDCLDVGQLNERGEREEQSEEDKIIERLYFKCFSGIRAVKRKGIVSIVKNGFYRAEDFEEEFTDWKKTEDFEIYLDVLKFHSMKNEEAKKVFENTDKAIFDKKTVKDPRTLLRLAGRMTRDIKRGTFDLNFETVKSNFRALFDEFYRSGEMELVYDLDLSWQIERMEYCMDLYEEVRGLNNEYNKNKGKFELSQFWIKLKNDPDMLDSFLASYRLFDVFAQYEDPKDVLDSIETLNNAQLLHFVRRMGSEVSKKRPFPLVDQNYARTQCVVAIIKQRYDRKDGVRCGHFKQIARVLKNQNADFDPEYKKSQSRLSHD